MNRRTSALIAAAALTLAAVAFWSGRGVAQTPPPGPSDGPKYGNGPNLIRPTDYRDWVFLSSSLGLSYQPPSSGNPTFQNVFVNPSSYRAFMQTGKWPDKTIFVLEFRQSGTPASANKNGKFQAALAGIEAEVKDSRFADGWAYYGFDQTSPAGGVAPLAGDTVKRCIDCHTQHTAVERTFVQFYPTLLEVAKQRGTVKANYTDP
jgi:hypothetical protein